MKVNQLRRWKVCVVAGATMALMAGMASTAPSAHAGGTIKVDDDKWISVGMGIRTDFTATENGAPNGNSYSKAFGIHDARIYLNGKIHKNIGFEFNTACFGCNGNLAVGGVTMGVLDAIGKFEFNQYVNVWVGRMLVPTERGELNGPFYHATYDGFKTPVGPADFSGGFGAGGAGKFGRDNGATFWGQVDPAVGHLQYAVGVYSGLQGSANQSSSMLVAGRLTYNFFNAEKNPGYYTAGTYYGAAGDILAIAVGGQHQGAGAGTAANAAAFNSFVSDVLFEKPLANDMGVITFNAEYKRYWVNYDVAAINALAPGSTVPGSGCFCAFNGQSYTMYGLYLFPQEVGIGKFQPYGRYTFIQPDTVTSVSSSNRDEIELGTNYVISGFNARISAFYTYGNFNNAIGGGAFSNFNGNGAIAPDRFSTFKVALQLQY